MLIRRWGKRLIAALLVGATLLLSGCQPVMTDDDALETKYITTTFYPLYSLAVNLVKEVPALSLSCLTQPQDGCLRSYELSDWDYQVLIHQDAVILAGRGLESFEGMLHQLPDSPILISVLEGRRLRTEDAGDPDDDNTHFNGENPWYFLSVAGAMEICMSIAGSMAEIDGLYAGQYAENLDAYLWKLEKLIAGMRETVHSVSPKPVAVLHEGLTYFAGQFDLDMALVYPREPGVDLIDNDFLALTDALSESGAQVVLVEEQAPDRLVAALETEGYAVARIDTLTAHMANGDEEAYERIMMENARSLRDALQRAGKNE